MRTDIIYPTNKYQTTIDAELKASVSSKVFSDLLEFITVVPWVKALVHPERKTAAELPRDIHGKIIVDLENPHVLEDMDYFVTSRDHFTKHGYYTSAKPSRNKNSEFKKFWDEERRRSLKGYVRESDGEWISGYNYWYWNYSRIELTAVDDQYTEEELAKLRENAMNVKSDRVEAFPDIWETDYFWFHYIDKAEESGMFASLLKCRGVGASLKAASMAHRNFFLIKKSKTYFFASLDEYLYTDGIMNKAFDSAEFIQANTAYQKRLLHNSLDGMTAGYKDKAKHNAVSGYRSEINPVNVRNAQASRGKRGKLIVYEEAGSNKSLIKSWGISHKSLDDRGNIFGLQLGMGTGGDKNSDFRGLLALFYKPAGYNVFAVGNIFDKNGTGETGWFIGEYMNRPGMFNIDGVSDVIRSLITIFTTREVLEAAIEDADVLAQKKAEGAITPQEAIVTMSGSPFPVDAVKERIAELTSNYAEITSEFHQCDVTRKGEKTVLSYGGEVFPITEFPYVGNRADKAAITLKELPLKNRDGTIPSYRYIIGVDPLEDDDDDPAGKSLFSFQLMDLWKDEIIGWYIGRRKIVAENFEMVLSVAVMYNATVNYESNLKGMYGHFNNHQALHYLADTPKILEDKALISKKLRIGNKNKGTRAIKAVNAWGRRLQADFMRTKHSYYVDLVGLDTIDDIEYLREVQFWEMFGNYDKV
ncbi:MAG: hypothetical protein KAH32_09220, partial [Chlamydiia bacterium]|nr:hypothetical protein [Chlamydiia bacterium]